MAKTIQAKALTQMQYTFYETVGQQTRTDTDNTQNSCDYTYGSGNFQITAILRTTGNIPSGSKVELNFASFPVDSFSVISSGSFSKIKSVAITNTSTTSGVDMNIRATGVSACSGLFNLSSGNLLIKPYSSYIYNDPYNGITISSNSKIQLHNMAAVSGNNLNYSVTVMGII